MAKKFNSACPRCETNLQKFISLHVHPEENKKFKLVAICTHCSEILTLTKTHFIATEKHIADVVRRDYSNFINFNSEQNKNMDVVNQLNAMQMRQLFESANLTWRNASHKIFMQTGRKITPAALYRAWQGDFTSEHYNLIKRALESIIDTQVSC